MWITSQTRPHEDLTQIVTGQFLKEHIVSIRLVTAVFGPASDKALDALAHRNYTGVV